MSIIVRDKAGNRKKIAGAGLPGPAGKSAYQYAVEGGFSGTETEFAALVGRVSNRNLLDNAYWASRDAIVNQRGQAVYTQSGYTIDRYESAGCSLTINDANIEVSSNGGHLMFAVEQVPANCLATFSILVEDLEGGCNASMLGLAMPLEKGLNTVTGIITTTQNKWWLLNYLYGTIKLKAAKLELGPVQTLVHKEPRSNYGETLPAGAVDAEDGTVWVLNDPPPDPALELLKCQRHQVFGILEAQFSTKSGSYYYCCCSLPVTLRARPSIIGTPVVSALSNNSLFDTAQVTVDAVFENGVSLRVSGVTEPVYIHGKFGFDANL